MGVATHCDASSLHIWLARSVSFRFALKNLFQTYFKRARKSCFPLYVPFKKNVKTNKVCTVRVSPRLSPSGPLKMRHSSICPKAENMTRMSFSLHFFDTMPMNSFLSSTAERKEGWKKQMWPMCGKKDVTAACDQCLISTSSPDTQNRKFSLGSLWSFFQWPERSLLPVICVCCFLVLLGRSYSRAQRL